MTGTSDASDYRRAARGGGASQGKRAMVRRSMSAGVLLIHNSLAGLVTLLDLSRTTSTDPVNLQISTEGGKAWSSSAAATSLERVPPGLHG